ncbi:MAG: hypothetical protein Q9213_007032 [Squamulea squamosa]
MDQLPQELVLHVASFIMRGNEQSGIGVKAKSKLPPYATLSRTWQLAIERRTFHRLRMTCSELPYLTKILTGHRKSVLSHLQYVIVLPTYSSNECAKFETEKDKERNSQSFTCSLHALFQFLKSWEVGDGEKNGLTRTYPSFRSFRLALYEIYSPMDRWHRDRKIYKEELEQYERGKRYDLWENRYQRSVLQLMERPQLPPLFGVSSFQLVDRDMRTVEPRSAVLLTSKFANLESVSLCLKDNEKKDTHLRQRYRYDFAMALPTISGPSLRNFELNYYQYEPRNQYFAPPSALLSSLPAIDHLSRALHALAQSVNLTYLRLGPIVISPDLYWPAVPSTATPMWPNLREFKVEFHMTTPDGEWYFIRDPTKPIDEDEGAYDSDRFHQSETESDTESDYPSDNSFWAPASENSFQPDRFNKRKEARAVGEYPFRTFRTLPSDALINPLLLAMARAAAHMPKLQDMSLKSTLDDPNAAGFAVYFNAAGHPSSLRSQPGDLARARLYWVVGSWRPENGVLKIWSESREGLLIKFFEF